MSAMLQDPNKMMTLTGKYGEMRRGTRTARATRGDRCAGKISGRVREESRAALISLTKVMINSRKLLICECLFDN